MDMEKIGKFIKALRKEKNLSQEALADMLLITRQAVSNWEVGKAIPDSEILLELSEIFGVTINELLKGERNKVEEELIEVEVAEEVDEQPIEVDKFQLLSEKLLAEYSKEFIPENNTKSKNKYNKQLKEAIEEKEELEKIALDLVDKYNDKSKILKSTSKILGGIIIAILLIFLIYYFVTSYNTIQVYKIYGEGDKFFTKDGVMINTKQKSYLRLGKIESHTDIKIENVKLYYIDDNNKQKELYNYDQTDILLSGSYGYDEFYSSSEVKYILKNLNLEITYNNGFIETIKLNFEKDFSNSLNYIIRDNRTVDSRSQDNFDELTKRMIKEIESKGKKDENGIVYEVIDKNKQLRFYYQADSVMIIVKEDGIDEIWINQIDVNNIIYRKIINYKEKEHKVIKKVEKSEMSEDEKEVYDNMIKNIEDYLFK